ncbi:hypothetical protein CB0940_02833 [Cercospora beticola]|uniref:BTB domain-containing protein n=1 Tax=Cercospora beticola TaxID=122368 RepID=A0A2G5I5E8_CERBT|nr:hypothetical protein CB0940_02833 [Cercospora beticola]PIB00030.1 hypothetical protein CB0940_02833 [Cercospora beticola]WPA99982.1 hypothetical protein RHO25_004602 [Cercospora beticola]
MAQYGMPTLPPTARRGGSERKTTAPNRSPASAESKKTKALPVIRKDDKIGAHVDTVTEVAREEARREGSPIVEEDKSAIDNPRGDAHGIIAIDGKGDIVLHIEHNTAAATLGQRYRVSSAALKSTSKYFERLLDGRFGESARIEKEHVLLRDKYGTLDKVPSVELPVIPIEDIGCISAVKSIEALCTDFLLILHARDTNTPVPTANLANLAIVADRFDALDIVRTYASRKKLTRAIEGKTTAKAESNLSEERVRQRILIGLLLDHAPWLDKYSARLITSGSKSWTGSRAEENDVMWWNLPHGLEEELPTRREYVLDMLQSSAAQFVGQYISRERQCRLGYDSSAACDSFQLGEMIRFLSRCGILQVKGLLYDAAEPPEPYTGDIFTLIDSLRHVPEYQIDRNHSHCGIRGRLISMLDMVIDALHYVGVCAECWTASRHEHAWMDLKRPLLWRSQAYRSRGLPHTELHAQVRTMFTATERDWK